MPVSTITTAFVKQYADNLFILSQQKGSKLQACVRNEPITSAEEAYWDTLGTVAAQKKTTRHGPTPNNEQTHGRRKCTPEDYNTCSLIDNEDKLKMIIDPTNGFALTQAAALGRTKDDIIIEAALGTALIGKTGATSIAFKDDSISMDGTAGGVVTTLGTLAAVGTVADIDLLKILTMMELFNAADVDPEIEKFWVVSPKDIKDMLDLEEVGSADYNTVRTLVQGKVDTYAGFKFLWSNRLTKDAATSTAYRTFAWAKDGIILGVGKEVRSRIDERNDLSYALQVYSEMTMGAVRMEGAKVHECLTKVAA
jgi:hypothetical protein